MRKIALGLLAAISFLAPSVAAAQTCPAVAALPDSERRVAYSPSASTGPFSINFAILGDSTDYSNWIEVWLNGVRLTGVTDWQLTIPSGTLATACRPITNASVTLTTAATGTLQIVGARRPRRTSQFAENAGVSARNLNQVITDIVATERETWDKINDVTGRGLFSQPGNTFGPMPTPAQCANGFLNFDATGLQPQCSNLSSSGTIAHPVSTTVNGLVTWGDTVGTTLLGPTGITFASGGPLSITTTASSATKGFSVSNPSPAGTQSSFALNLIQAGFGTPDAINAGATAANNALLIQHRFGASGLQGGRQSLAVQSVLTSASNVADALPQYVAGSFLAQGNASGGGSAFTSLSTTKSAMYGINPICTLVNTATFYSECTGAEFNIDVHTGASAWYVAAATFVSISTHKTKGFYYDAVVALSAQTGSVASDFGILFGPMNSAHPVAATGTLIGAVVKNRDGVSPDVAATVDKGVDFSLYTITTSAFKSSGFNVSGSGAITGLSVNVTGTTAATSATTGSGIFGGGVGVAGAIWAGTYLNTTTNTVNGLPACAAGTKGARTFVNDNNTALAFAAVITTGGAIQTPVYCDGTVWRQG